MTPDEQAVKEIRNIPEFLKRRKEDSMSEEQFEPQTEDENDDAAKHEPTPELTIEEMFAHLNKMTEQRDKLNTAISAYKKSIQRRVGRL